MKKEISNLLKKGSFEKVFRVMEQMDLRDEYSNQITLLSSRYSKTMKDDRQGILRADDVERSLSRIRLAILSITDEMCKNYNLSDNNNINEKKHDVNMIESLQAIQSNYKRKNKELSSEAKELINKIQSYKNSEATSSTWDVSGRKWDELKKEYNAVVAKEKKVRLDRLEEINDKIGKLISDDIPSYDNLDKAYSLLLGYGYRDETVKDQLRAKVDDEDVRIQITDRIEKFLNRVIVDNA